MPLRPVSELGLVEITDVPARGGNRTATSRRSTRAHRSQSQSVPRDSASDHQRQGRGNRSKGAHASRQRKPAVRGTASKTLADAPQTSAPAKSRSTGAPKRVAPSQRPRSGPATRTDQTKVADAQARLNSKPRRMSASAETSSQRSRSRSKAANGNGSGGAKRRATTRTPKRSTRSANAPHRAKTARQQSPARSRTKGNHASREAQRSRTGRRPNQTKPAVAAKIGISVLMGVSLIAGGLLVARAALQR